MNKPPFTPAGASLTDEQIALALPLLEAGVSVRRLASELGCSKHSAAVLIDAARGTERPPRTKKPKAPKVKAELGPAAAPAMPPWAPVTAALAPREPEPNAQPFEDLQRTRQAIAEKLDAAIHRNDREAVSSFSLALARLDKTADPGAQRSSTEIDPNLSLLPDAVFEFIHFALATVTPKSDGGGLSADDQIKAAFYFAAFEAIAAMFDAQQPVRGMPIAVTFCTPDALIFRSENAREKPGTVAARIQDAREASTEAR